MEVNHFEKYLHLRRAGSSPAQVYLQAVADGLKEIACFRLLREVFGLTLVEAKRVIVEASGASSSLEARQEQILPGLKRALEDFEDRD